MSKERLVELHEEAVAAWDTYLDMCEEQDVEPEKTFDEFVADHILADGVIVPPCKVGDTVYEIVHGVVGETEAVGFIVCQDGTILMLTKHLFPLSREIGKTVFLTREEAEKALEKRWKER